MNWQEYKWHFSVPCLSISCCKLSCCQVEGDTRIFKVGLYMKVSDLNWGFFFFCSCVLGDWDQTKDKRKKTQDIQKLNDNGRMPLRHYWNKDLRSPQRYQHCLAPNWRLKSPKWFIKIGINVIFYLFYKWLIIIKGNNKLHKLNILWNIVCI